LTLRRHEFDSMASEGMGNCISVENWLC